MTVQIKCKKGDQNKIKNKKKAKTENQRRRRIKNTTTLWSQGTQQISLFREVVLSKVTSHLKLRQNKLQKVDFTQLFKYEKLYCKNFEKWT